MTIKQTSIGTELYADEGRAIRPKLTRDPVVESVMLSPSDSPANWEDCDRPEETTGNEPTMDDANAALRRFGVEV